MKSLKWSAFLITLLTPSVGIAGGAVRSIAPQKIVDSIGVPKGDGFSGYLSALYGAGVAGVAVIAVVMIVWGAIQVFGESVWGKTQGKSKIWNAVWGLLLAAGSFVILRTVSDSLTQADFQLSETLGAETQGTNIGAPTTGGSTGGTSNRPTTGGSGSGSIASNTTSGMTFPDDSWDAYALEQIRNSGLLNMSPSDAARYFPNGVPTEQGYLSLLASIANSESGFDVTDNLDHSLGTDVGNTYSVGLFSLTHTDSAWRNLGYSESDLGDPYKQINAAVDILRNQVSSTGSIGGSSGNHYWGPLYRGE